jgi:hypothetical protein
MMQLEEDIKIFLHLSRGPFGVFVNDILTLTGPAIPNSLIGRLVERGIFETVGTHVANERCRWKLTEKGKSYMDFYSL